MRLKELRGCLIHICLHAFISGGCGWGGEDSFGDGVVLGEEVEETFSNFVCLV